MNQATVMNYCDERLTRHAIDWDAPELRTLIEKSDGWQLDNRATRDPISCELYLGWGAEAGKRATLVYERNGVVVVETRWIIPKGENVRTDYVQAGMRRSRWGVIAEALVGRRAEDLANGTHVYWIHPI